MFFIWCLLRNLSGLCWQSLLRRGVLEVKTTSSLLHSLSPGSSSDPWCISHPSSNLQKPFLGSCEKHRKWVLFSTPCSFFFLFVLWVLSFLSRKTVPVKLMFWQGVSAQNKSNSFFLYVSTAFLQSSLLPVSTPHCLTGNGYYLPPPMSPPPQALIHLGKVHSTLCF